ncbi:MAG TPA: pteridine reductase [Spongiibacteraceae bacterium]|nr:pteridine reductase [Spongiibacteraceae bacterium]
MTADKPPVVLITGAAKRIGQACVRWFHRHSYRVAVHHRAADGAADALVSELNRARPGSAAAYRADLGDTRALAGLPGRIARELGPLSALINNASGFYPTPVDSASEQDWQVLMDSNLKGPFFLTQACLPWLREQRGAVVNIVDIYAEKPLAGHSVYCMAKAGLAMMTRALAQELAPAVRVNGIAPGAILWPEQDNPGLAAERLELARRVPLARTGEPDDIARTAWFLINDAPYITGQIIAVDGGRSVNP